MFFVCFIKPFLFWNMLYWLAFNSYCFEALFQVLIRYGKFSNATLLLDFGFTVPYNIYDQVSPRFDQVYIYTFWILNSFMVTIMSSCRYLSSVLLTMINLKAPAFHIFHIWYYQVQVKVNIPPHDFLRRMKLDLLHKHLMPAVKDVNSVNPSWDTFTLKLVLVIIFRVHFPAHEISKQLDILVSFLKLWTFGVSCDYPIFLTETLFFWTIRKYDLTGLPQRRTKLGDEMEMPYHPKFSNYLFFVFFFLVGGGEGDDNKSLLVQHRLYLP